MTSSTHKRRVASALRRLWTLRGVLEAVRAELRRLNSFGLHGDTHLSRAARAALVRGALARKYRDRSPCC
ncbi:MAG TPA: hypothetical protein VFE56_02825 [Candidatus Binataceae bacterium]|nr:hypothetical protein [Candidatus Binataceae bacterium]